MPTNLVLKVASDGGSDPGELCSPYAYITTPFRQQLGTSSETPSTVSAAIGGGVNATVGYGVWPVPSDYYGHAGTWVVQVQLDTTYGSLYFDGAAICFVDEFSVMTEVGLNTGNHLHFGDSAIQEVLVEGIEIPNPELGHLYVYYLFENGGKAQNPSVVTGPGGAVITSPWDDQPAGINAQYVGWQRRNDDHGIFVPPGVISY